MDNLSHKAQQIKDDLEDLLTIVNWDDEDKQQYEYYKKRLELIESRIVTFKNIDIVVDDKLKNQKLRYKMKVLDYEESMQTKSILNQVATKLNAVLNLKTSSANKKLGVLVNNFNSGNKPVQMGAGKASKIAKSEIKNLPVTELAKLINKICEFKGEEKVTVKNDELFLMKDQNFHFNLFRLIFSTSIKKVLEETNVDKTQRKFYPSEILGHYMACYFKRLNN